jgi:type I restriction enzyme R subunit
MNLHREIHFEEPICEYLGAQGWQYAEGDADRYDRARALFPADVLTWVRETQPQGWEALTKSHGAATETVLLDRLRKQMDERGTLDVLRHGIELLGLRRPLATAQFKPALAMNPDLQARYAANRLRVVRQVRPSSAGVPCGIGQYQRD